MGNGGGIALGLGAEGLRRRRVRVRRRGMLLALGVFALAGYLAGQVVGQQALLAQSSAYKDPRPTRLYVPAASPQPLFTAPLAGPQPDSHGSGHHDKHDDSHHHDHGNHGGG